MVKDHNGNEYKELAEMCEAYHLSTSTYYQRINVLGWSQEKALTTPVRKKKKTVPEVKVESEEKKTRDKNGVIKSVEYVPEGKMCSVEYLRYLQCQVDNIRNTILEMTGKLPEEVLDALTKEEIRIMTKMKEVKNTSYFYRTMDFYAASEMEAFTKSADIRCINQVVSCFEFPYLMSDLMREIYIDFNGKYRVVAWKPNYEEGKKLHDLVL